MSGRKDERGRRVDSYMSEDNYRQNRRDHSSPRRSRSRDRASHRSRSRDRSPKDRKYKKEGREVWGNVGREEEEERKNKPEAVKEEDKVKANFGLSGALAKDEITGNLLNGVLLKFNEPLDAAVATKQWRLYVFKGESIVESIHIHKKSVFIIGRDKRVADILLLHPASSKQHAVIQFRKVKVEGTKSVVKPYLMDLQSANKTFLNGKEVEDSRYYELKEKDFLRFGLSEKEYVLLCANDT